MIDILPVRNSIDVFVKQFRDSSTGTVITTATFAFSIYDTSGVVVAGASAISMPHISSGHYRGSLNTAALLTVGSRYRVVVTCSNFPVEWTREFVAAKRPYVI